MLILSIEWHHTIFLSRYYKLVEKMWYALLSYITMGNLLLADVLVKFVHILVCETQYLHLLSNLFEDPLEIE